MRRFLLTAIIFGSFAANAQHVITDFDSQKKRIIKMEFFSPLTGNTTVGYEQYIKDWVSWEAKVGLIGLGTDPGDVNPNGVFFRGGPKFKLNPDFATDGTRGTHLLSGKYIRPELVMSFYSRDETTYDEITGNATTARDDFSSVAVLINYGRQFVLADIMSLDYHVGLGYGYNSSGEAGYNYSHSTGAKQFPVAVSAGFTVGVLLK